MEAAEESSAAGVASAGGAAFLRPRVSVKKREMAEDSMVMPRSCSSSRPSR